MLNLPALSAPRGMIMSAHCFVCENTNLQFDHTV